MKLTIGVTTCNRPRLLSMSMTSLLRSRFPGEWKIRVYDDASNEIPESFFAKLSEVGAAVHRRERRIGPDASMRAMFLDFVQTGDDAILVADSDLIYNPHWHIVAAEAVPRTDGVLSLFNAFAHPAIGEVDDLVEKRTIGGAGAILARPIVDSIIRAIDRYHRDFDWQWCNLLRRSGKKIYCTKKSYVQHLGWSGRNSGSWSFDYGMGFDPGHMFNARCIENTVEEFTRSMHLTRLTRRKQGQLSATSVGNAGPSGGNLTGECP